MKQLMLVLAVAITVSGCASNDISQVMNDGVNGAINGVLGSVGGTDSVVKNEKSYSVERERMYTTEATRTRKDFGSIQVTKTEKNPQSKTQLVLESCVHPRIGSVKCQGFLYEVTPEGWLVDDKVSFNSDYNKGITLASGTYYFKLNTSGVGNDYYVTGEATITPFVTNYVALTLE
ncbi:hypothetical protein [Vibrio navarrensis]|uniref:hypothetical protein n=1 Tax=Vibrio navarrensis TaxID=29495 RepID=UPI0018698DE3|nr:hypothetical protein [Vibrio navarrensis]MBE4600011.1 hypothetical protein [Vibrio navarrensis]